MRNLEDIEKDLAEAREALSCVEGTPAEVYSRIVGYYRSVRNWNLGKKEEYGERRLYRIRGEVPHAAASSPSFESIPECTVRKHESHETECKNYLLITEMRLLLFVRASCPNCQSAKAAAGRLGIPVILINTDTSEGMLEAINRNILSTPTALLLSPQGQELKRARDAGEIRAFADIIAKNSAEYAPLSIAV